MTVSRWSMRMWLLGLIVVHLNLGNVGFQGQWGEGMEGMLGQKIFLDFLNLILEEARARTYLWSNLQ
jgi:hypothetical protein